MEVAISPIRLTHPTALLVLLPACSTYPILEPTCEARSVQTTMTSTAAVGFSAEQMVETIGDALSYDATWEPVDERSPLPSTVSIAFGPPSEAWIRTSEPLREGVYCQGPQLSVHRPYTLTVGDEAVSSTGISWVGGREGPIYSIDLLPQDTRLGDEHRLAAEAWVDGQGADLEIESFTVRGLNDPVAATLTIRAWGHDANGDHQTMRIWHSSQLDPL